MRARGPAGVLLALALASALTACAEQEEAPASPESMATASSSAPAPTDPTDPPTDPPAPSTDPPAPPTDPPATADDLDELDGAAGHFVAWIRGGYRLGRSPFSEAGVDLYLGGAPAGHLDYGTEPWSFACDQWYGASDCPVVLTERMLRRELVAIPGRADVLCAPTSAPLPPSLPAREGVSVQPVDNTCSDGFGITLWTDARGGIRAVDLQLSEP